MPSAIRHYDRTLITAVLVAASAVSPTLVAQAPSHLVTPSQLQQSAVKASRARQQNVDTLQKFFSSPEAQTALESAHIKPQEVKKAVAGLSDQELAQLAQRANKAQSDFAAGQMSDHDLLLVLVLIAALILIIVAVH
jgi:hypothetical protein